MKFSLIALVLLCTGFLAACDGDGSPASPKDAQSIADSMTYVKAKNGLCFGAAQAMNSDISNSYVMVVVPCEKVGL
jgi:hypothetical protein